MANTEAPNTLLSNATFRILDLVCEGPISGFVAKPGTYGLDPLVSTYYDDVPIRNLDGSYNFNITGQGYSFNYTLGGSDQTGIAGFQKVECILPLSSNTRIANPPVGAGPFKPVIASFTSNTFPDADQIKVTVRVPALYAQDEEANTSPYEIQYRVEISMNNGAWVTVGNERIVGKCTSAYQKTTVYQLPKAAPANAFYEWKVKVSRVTQNILSVRTANEIFVDSISVVSSSLFAYPNSVIVGTEIASEQFSSVPSRAYEIAGMLVSVPSGYTPTNYGFDTGSFTRQCDVEDGSKHIGFTTPGSASSDRVTAGVRVEGAGIPANTVVTYVYENLTFFTVDQDPTATNNNTTLTFFPTETVQTISASTYPNVWLGDFVTGVWTDNPAWIFYDLCTNQVHGLGDIIRSEYVDKWALYEISQYCDTMVDDGQGGTEPRFTCNVAIQDQEDAYNVLLNLASTFRGMLYYANGAIHATQQQDKPPVHEFTNSNVVGGEFNYADTARDTRATVAKVKWVDPDNGYRENVEYIEDIDGILRYGYQEKEMTAFACTSKGQAYRLGSWTLESERLLTETVQFKTDMEGVALRPGDNFAVYDNFRTNKTQAGRIIGFSPARSQVTLDVPVPIEAGYIYSINAIVPKYQMDGTGDLTGSNQIEFIRQSQVESFVVNSALTTPTSGTATIVISGSFSTGLYIGSPFILSASGLGTASVFTQASFYTCVATAEVEPGQIEVLGLQANTGVQFSIQTGYTIVDWPVNSGDLTSPILPPTSLLVTGITGLTNPDNTFYSAINLTWVHSPSPDLSHYIVSGREFDTAYEHIGPIFGTGTTFTRGDTGQYLFRLAAISLGGRQSTFVTGGFLVSNKNPLGTLRSLSGVRLVENYDPLYTDASLGYTGYVGLNPVFEWTNLVDSDGVQIVDKQFISGYRIAAKSFDGATDYITPFTVSGANANRYRFTDGQIYAMAGGPQRGFDFRVDWVDWYGGTGLGANLNVNNPVMKPPFSSGFVGYNGGLIYNVTPSLQYDTSGICLWMNRSSSFAPTFENVDYASTNLGGVAPNSFNTGTYWSWFALTDTFGRTGNAIYGPISGNSAGVFQTFDFDISKEIDDSFALLTGMITNSSTIFSGSGSLILQMVNGLSGQVMGTTAGNVDTALSVRVDTAVVSSSGAVVTQINAVSSRVELTGIQGRAITVATGAQLLSTIATTGGALATWITNLSAQTTGATAQIKIGAQAFVTGATNGIGGVAIATWGFSLDANGRVVSMRATSSNVYGQDASFGVIEFGGADLQSENYTAGVDGWLIEGNGNAEFNQVMVRGELFINSGGSDQVVAGTNSAGTDGFTVGGGTNSLGDRITIEAGITNHVLQSWNSSNRITAGIGTNASDNGGQVWAQKNQASNINTVTMIGGDSTVNAYTAAGARSVFMDGVNARLSGENILLGKGAGGAAAVNKFGGIKYSGGATNVIGFAWVGADLRIYVDGLFIGNVTYT